MISRVAESCFWLMRYVERCDTTARLLRVHSAMVLDTVGSPRERWQPLLIVEGEWPRFTERFGEDAAGDGEIVQNYLTWDVENPVSIASSMQMARENARTVRETLSLEMWNSLNAAWLWLSGDDVRRTYDLERQAFFEEVSNRCHLFHGLCHNTMLHEEPFDFMRLGLNLERAGQTARILDLRYHRLGSGTPLPTEALDAVELITILRTCSAYEPFFKKRQSALSASAVIEFLLLETSFPGSVLHAVTRAQNFLRRIRTDEASPIGRRSVELLDKLHEEVAGLDVHSVFERGTHDVSTRIVEGTSAVSSAIREEYFYPSLPETVDSSHTVAVADQLAESSSA